MRQGQAKPRDASGKVVEIHEYVEVVKLKRRKHPDTTAQIFWSKNRRPDLWRDVQKTEHEHKADADTHGTLRGKAALDALMREGFVELEGEYTIVDDTVTETIANER
jgi:hypothetical protein